MLWGGFVSWGNMKGMTWDGWELPPVSLVGEGLWQKGRWESRKLQADQWWWVYMEAQGQQVDSLRSVSVYPRDARIPAWKLKGTKRSLRIIVAMFYKM